MRTEASSHRVMRYYAVIETKFNVSNLEEQEIGGRFPNDIFSRKEQQVAPANQSAPNRIRQRPLSNIR